MRVKMPVSPFAVFHLVCDVAWTFARGNLDLLRHWFSFTWLLKTTTSRPSWHVNKAGIARGGAQRSVPDNRKAEGFHLWKAALAGCQAPTTALT